MLRLTLAQMRRSLGRLAAGGIAIAIGTAFVAATLIAGAIITRTSYDAVTAGLADADLVTTRLSPDDVEKVEALPLVDAVQPVVEVGGELRNGPKRVYVTAQPRASDPRLEVQTVTDGALPATNGEIALPTSIAERLGVGVGDEITSTYTSWPAADASDTTEGATEDVVTEGTEVVAPLRVVGLLADPKGAFSTTGGVAVLSVDDALAWSGVPTLAEAAYGGSLVVLAPGADVTAARAQLDDALPEATVWTKDEAAQVRIASLTDGKDMFTALVLGFAAIALLVAALVISNTFQVLVAQRTRTLALLRCVGAGKRQLRFSVIFEAAVLGFAASVVGLVSGTVLAQVTLVVLRGTEIGVPLPTTVSITPSVVLVPLLVGTLVTVLASLMPARAATRVAPVAALRPADAPAITSRSSRVRLVLSTVCAVLGFVALALGVLAGRSDPMAGLLVGVAGGTLSFVGVLLGAVFWVPRVVAVAGRLLARTGTSAKLAAANTVRNPRRTAATSTALLIGVTLVALMSTGAASARSTLGNELDTAYPVDVSVSIPSSEAGVNDALPTSVEAAVSRIDGVDQTAPVFLADATVGAAGAADATDGGWVSLQAVEPADAARVMRTSAAPAALSDSTVVMREVVASRLGVEEGDRVPVQISANDGESEPGAAVALLRVEITDFGGTAVLVTPATLEMLAPEAAPSALWVRLADVDDAGRAFAAIQDALVDTPVMINGSAVERAQYQGIIDTMLAIVVGLLAVAIVIALVGVANTLSLSVLERRRESATLRAIGLSRRQLRWMLAVEGMLISGVGAVLGVALGMLYGWAGSATLLGTIGNVSLAVPWRDLALVVVVALVAGLLASVLPGRAAARTSPVAALAVD